MSVFELVDGALAGDNTPILFDDAALQGAFINLEELFAELGYPSSPIPSFKNRLIPHKIGLVMEEILPEDSVQEVIAGKISEVETRINELKAGDQVQHQHIGEAKGFIEQSKISYTNAVLRGDDAAISGIEQQVIDAEQVIKLAEMRRSAIDEAVSSVSRYLETIKTMWGNIDFRRQQGIEQQAREVLHGQIAVFAQQVADYKAIKAGLTIHGILDDQVAGWIKAKLPLRV